MFRATTPARRPVPPRAARRPAAVAALIAATAGAAALGATVLGCRDLTVPEQDPTTVRYADSLRINIANFTRDTSGVYYQDVAVGSGLTAVTGSLVRYYYTGYLTDGRRFGTNLNATTTTLPDTFVVGQGRVIRGFDRGLLGVRAGGRRRLVIPPALAYGNSPPAGNAIPAGAILVYIVDVPAVVAPATTTTTTAAPARTR